MFQATKAIYEAFKRSDGLKPFTDETEKSSNVWLQFGVEGGGNYKIRFISHDDDNDVSVRVYSLLSIPEAKRAKLIGIVNDLNCEFRYAKFVLDKDGDVNVEYDYPVKCSNPAESAPEIVARMVRIIDKAYPRLMQGMWA